MGTLAYEAIRKDAFVIGPNDGLQGAWLDGVKQSGGRQGLKYWMSLGYVPCDVGVKGSLSITLDYSHADFAVAQAALAMGHTDDAKVLLNRSAAGWRHVFDPSDSFMKPKTKAGVFEAGFDQWAWGDAYTEGGPWQYRFGVPWDAAGLADAYGGPEKFVAALDSIFTTPPLCHHGGYGSEIHEMTEMALESTPGFKFGQYEHNNQPVHHELYMYAAAAATPPAAAGSVGSGIKVVPQQREVAKGCPSRTAYWVRQTMTRLYTPDSFCGDEDNGEFGLWYVLSALGLYSVAPGTQSYLLGGPLFAHAQVNLPGGSPLEVIATGNSKTNMYVQSATFNGEPVEGLTLQYEQLIHGGKLEFIMGPEPSKSTDASWCSNSNLQQ